MAEDAPRGRERLLECGAAALAADELVALLLGAGSRAACAADVARALLQGAGGLRELSRCTASELRHAPGIGPAQAARLAAAFELARRVASEGPRRGAPIRSGADVFRLLQPRLRDLRREVFVALLLDGRNRLLREERVSMGSLTTSIVHPREVFAAAIRESAGAIVVAHNHPSGDPTPSREDLEVTARLAEVGRIVGIALLDHVIVGDPGFVSLRERGYLPPADAAASRDNAAAR
jgi:DNA repair protein RadC